MKKKKDSYQVIMKQSEIEGQYRRIVENIPDVLWTTDREWKTNYISPTIEKVLGYTPEEVYKKKSISLGRIHKEDIKEVERSFRKLFKDGSSFDVKYRIKRKDGEWVWVHDRSVTTYERDGVLYADGILTDITFSKQTEEALRNSEERLKIIFESAPDAIYLNDFKGNFLDGNRTAEELIGYKKEELIGRNFLNLKILSVKDLPTAIKNLAKNVLGKRTGPDEFLMNRKDGSQIFLEVSNFPVKIDNKGMILGIARDISSRKKAEKGLKKSEEKMQSIFRVAPTGIGMVSERILLEVNPRICEMTGYRKEELTGKNARMLYPNQEEFEYVGKEKYRQIAELGSGIVETVWQRKNGLLIDVLLSSTPVDNDFLSKGVIFTVLDITERNQVNRFLKENEKKFRTLVSNIPGATYRCDLDENWTMKFLSDQIKNLSGYPSEDFIENRIRTFTSIIHPDDRKLVEEQIIKAVDQKVPFQIEYRIIHRDGDVRWIHENGQGFFDDGDEVKYLDGVLLDITERKQAEEAVSLSETHYRQLFDSLPYGGEVIDREGRIINCSQSTLQMLGYEKDEVIGEHITNFIDEDSKRNFRQSMPRILKGESLNKEICMVHKDGSMINVLRRAQPVFDQNGEVTNILAMSVDITERKKAEEEILKLKSGLEVQVAEKTKELSEKIEDLQRFFDAAVDRELRMEELYSENEKLKAKLSGK